MEVLKLHRDPASTGEVSHPGSDHSASIPLFLIEGIIGSERGGSATSTLATSSRCPLLFPAHHLCLVAPGIDRVRTEPGGCLRLIPGCTHRRARVAGTRGRHGRQRHGDGRAPRATGRRLTAPEISNPGCYLTKGPCKRRRGRAAVVAFHSSLMKAPYFRPERTTGGNGCPGSITLGRNTRRERARGRSHRNSSCSA